MTVCSTCKHANYCEIVAGGYSSQVKSCRDYRKGEQTNEEWFDSLSTEEKAEWFGKWHSFSCVFCKYWRNGCIYNHNQFLCAVELGKSNKECWLDWLKEVHTDEHGKMP